MTGTDSGAPAPVTTTGRAGDERVPGPREAAEAGTGQGHRSVVDGSVRVDVERLDSLMRLVGELVLARNQLVSHLDDNAGEESARDTGLARSAQRLSLVTSELQEQVMKTRMQPVDSVWSKMPRIVRDLAKQCGRMVRLEMQGRETELDRSVLEAIKDPLTRLVRHAVGHGIEPPEVRAAAGKNAEGLLRLRAYHEAGQVHLEVTDDGAGLLPEAFDGPASTGTGAADAADLAELGVGMGSIRSRIEAIGGAVEVKAAPGKGCTVRLTIPLTLAIIPALTIGCAGRRYAVPQVSVLELVRLSGEHARGGIELISGAPVYRLRDLLLPLVRLDEQLGLVPARQDGDPADGGASAEDGRGGFIVVLHAEGQRFGLVVDDVLDTQEIVVKPLGKHLKGLQVYAGATILGDGAVVLILDAATLAKRSRVLNTQTGVDSDEELVQVTGAEPVLVVAVAGDRRAAIPLDQVTRLEEVPVTAVEHVGGREVVQYRGQIMPLLRLSNLLGAYGHTQTEEEEPTSLQLVVHTERGRSVGLVVDKILDIAAEQTGTRSDLDDTALLGSAVIGDRVVELLDVTGAVLAADPHFHDHPFDGTAVEASDETHEELS